MRYKSSLFNDKDNKRIRSCMKKWGYHRNRFVKTSKLMPNRTAKQISNHWRNYLNPHLCHDPLTQDEKKFIVERARKYQTVIHWKYVIHDLEKKFGKLRSENKVKNFWNSTSLVKNKKLNRITIKSLLNPE